MAWTASALAPAGEHHNSLRRVKVRRCGTRPHAGTREYIWNLFPSEKSADESGQGSVPHFPRKDRTEEMGPDPSPSAILALSIWPANLNRTDNRDPRMHLDSPSLDRLSCWRTANGYRAYRRPRIYSAIDMASVKMSTRHHHPSLPKPYPSRCASHSSLAFSPRLP